MLENTKEANEKTLFGSYKAYSLKELRNILQVLEKGNLHLVDLGKKISSIHSFDIPALKKSVKFAETEERETKSRIVQNDNSIRNKVQEKKEYLQKLNLSEEGLHQKIAVLVYSLPSKIDEIVNELKKANISNYIKYYKDFNNYMNPNGGTYSLEHLEFVLKEGDNIYPSPVLNFNYQSYFESRGYYNNMDEEIDIELIDENDWGIEEVGDESSPLKVTLEPQPSILLSKATRLNFVSELQELALFISQKADILPDDLLNTYDEKLKAINSSISTAELRKAGDILGEITNKFNDEEMRRIFGFIESDRAKLRITKMIEGFNSVIEKKRAHNLKCNDTIADLATFTKETKKEIQKKTQRALLIAKDAKELLSKLIGKKVEIVGLR